MYLSSVFLYIIRIFFFFDELSVIHFVWIRAGVRFEVCGTACWSLSQWKILLGPSWFGLPAVSLLIPTRNLIIIIPAEEREQTTCNTLWIHTDEKHHITASESLFFSYNGCHILMRDRRWFLYDDKNMNKTKEKKQVFMTRVTHAVI